MRRMRTIVLVSWPVVLCGMASGMGVPAPGKRCQRLGREFLRAYRHFYPIEAAASGLHVFDGMLPDRSAERIHEWIARNQAFQKQLERIRPESLSAEDRVDYYVLKFAVGNELSSFTLLRSHRRNPMFYDFSWGLLNLIRRDYAPLEQRMQAAIRLMEAAPRMFEQARANLDAVLPRIYCRVAIANFNGSADFVRKDCVAAFDGVKDAPAKAKLKAAAERAASAVAGFVSYLEHEKLPGANDDFALGEVSFVRYLHDTEGVDLSVDALRAIGRRDLDRNLARAQAIADAHFPGQSIADVMGIMKSRAYTAEALLPSIAAELDEIRRFCIDHEIITIPSDVRAIVAETPKFARWASAMMSTPGPFETVATEAYYDVTPVDPKWSAEEKRQWLADFNRYVARNVSVHEAYPGHYVQFLHSNQAKSDLQKVFVSYAGTEGWAHYAEQMMIEQGFGREEPLYEMAQLQDALLRNCRFICAIDMHTHGMTVEEATRFIEENAFLGRLPARREAERGTFDPGYFKYTLGKLQILKLRADYKKKMGDGFSLKRFHDELLSRGLPPIVVVRERMLGAGSGSSL